MSVDCLKNFSLEDVLKARIDYTSGGAVSLDYPPDTLGLRCTVLQADKIRFGDKSTTGSPISSHRGSSVHHDSSGSSSNGSPTASPFSYTLDLIGVDSPGLSGGAGALTPVRKEQTSPMVPRQALPTDLQPRSVMLTAEPAPQPATTMPPRKSRFDIKPEDVMEEAKPMIGPILLPNGKRKAPVESEEEKDDEEEETVDPRRAGSLGMIVKRIKLETLSTTVTKPTDMKTSVPEVKPAPPPPPPLLPRAVARTAPPTPPPKIRREELTREEEREETTQESNSEDEENSLPFVGPQLPKKTHENGFPKQSPVKETKSLSRQSSSTSLTALATAAAGATASAATTGAAGSVTKGARRRLLSERGEKELKYPLIEKEISSKWGWEGATWMNGQKRGQGLINRANDCFLNVILQMITHTAPLARYLVESHKTDCKRESHACVACAMREHHLVRTFRVGQPMETRWISPHLKRIFPSHSFGMQEDAHELLSLLLDAIDPPPGWNRENGNKELPTNKLKPSTPIEQIFGGTLRNQVTCQSCSTPFINYERIRELNVALGRKQDDRIPLVNLVQDYFKNETIAAFSCKKCARKTQAVRQTRVLRAPAVLIVQLKRFNAYGGKIRQPIAAEKELDLTRFTYDAHQDGEGGPVKRATYALSGVVEHLGSTVDHGHYIAYCKAADNMTWFKFDDEEVSRVPTHSSNPYLLFYSRKDLQSKPKNGQMNGVAASSSTPSNSKVVTSPYNVVKQLAMSSNGNGNSNGYGGYGQNGGGGSSNGGMRVYQNKFGNHIGNHNGNHYGTAGKYPSSNGYNNNKKWSGNGGGNYSNNNNNSKWNNNGGRPIKAFSKWDNRQNI